MNLRSESIHSNGRIVSDHIQYAQPLKTDFDLRRLHQVFDAVADLPPGPVRMEKISALCEGEDFLRSEVEALLAASERDGGFMSEPEIPPDGAAFEAPPDLREGAIIGRYRLLEQIGEGANAIVFMVEQTETLRRRAALKIIKAGMDTREVIARFESERQALAMMDHPNIAKVFDAGATATGRPYFVMELVKGIPITEYCDLNKLGTRERLELFIPVCQALLHAHLKGVIHRDVKPSNVLVTLHDGVPVPKVIDFGIAKATGSHLTDRTLFTRFHQFIGTPAYMSPEQAEMSGLDIDTRTDVYSLGVLLYELLTGSTPFDGKKMMEGGFSEIQRVIRDRDPETPSTRLSTMSSEGLTAVAKSRRINPGELSRDIVGDLDWIVMKALEKDRMRRYETVGEFMRDVRRHLDNEPVEAGPPGHVYRVRKFVLRHRPMVVAVSLVTLSLVIALLIASFGLVRARRDAAAARREAEKADTVIALLDEMFHSASPDSNKGRDFKVTELLDDFSGRIDDQLASEPEVELTLRRTVGLAYDGLGESLRAEPHLRQALQLAREIHGPESAQTADLLAHLGWLTHELDNDDGAIEKLEAAAALQVKLLGRSHPDHLRSLAYLSAVLLEKNDLDQARSLAEEVLASAEGTKFPDLPWVRQTLAAIYQNQGEHAKAAKLADTLVEEIKVSDGGQRPRTLGALHGLVRGQIKHGQFDEAENLTRIGLETARRTLAPEHRVTLLLLGDTGDLARAKGDNDSALEIFREVLETQRRTLGDEHPDTIQTLLKLAGVGLEQNQIALAGRAAQDAFDAAARSHGEDDELTLESVCELAETFLRQKHYQPAETILRGSHRSAVAAHGPDHEITLRLAGMLADLYQRQDRNETAGHFYRDILTRTRQKFGEDDPKTREATENLADLLEKEYRYAEAQELAAGLLARRGSIADLSRMATLCRKRGIASRAISLASLALAKSVTEYGPEAEISLALKIDLAEAHDLLFDSTTAASILAGELQTVEAKLGKNHDLTRKYRSALNSLNKAAEITRGHESRIRSEFERTRSEFGISHEKTLKEWGDWIMSLQSQDPQAASREMEAYLESARASVGEEDPHFLRARHVEAWLAIRQLDDGRAENLYRKLIDDELRLLPENHGLIKGSLSDFSDFLLRHNRREDADRLIDSWQDGLTDSQWPVERTEILVSRRGPWRFLNYETDEGSIWKESGGEAPPTVSGLSWRSGLAPFGYGIVDAATSPILVEGRFSHTTFYFRRVFEIEDVAKFDKLKIRLLREDGAAVYLNGREVVRDNLPPGAAFDTPAKASWQVSKSAYYVYLIDRSLLQNGENVIAVEVHQEKPNSTDMAFDLELSALLTEPSE